MESQLLPGTILKDRYHIIKTVIWRIRGGVYEAWDKRVTDQRWIIKEVIPPRMSADELAARRELFYDTLEILKYVEHPNLARIIDYFTQNGREYAVIEYIDGITFAHFMSALRGLKEKEVLEIGLTICDAIHHLRDRPRPLVFENLDLNHLMFDYDKNIKFIGYDLSKFFTEPFPFKNFANTPEQAERTVYNISRILLFMLCRLEEVPREKVPEDLNVSDEFRTLLSKTLSPHQKAYSSILEYKEALDRVLNPRKYEKIEKEKEEKREEAEIEIPSFSWFYQIPQKLKKKVLGQSNWMLFIEVIAVLLIAFSIFVVNYPEMITYKLPEGVGVAYVTAGDTLYTFREDSFKLLDKRVIGKQVRGAFFCPEFDQILVCEGAGQQIYRVNVKNNQVAGAIPVDYGPSQIIGDGRGEKLFVLHLGEDNVTIIDRKQLAGVGILAVGIKSQFMEYSPQQRILYVSNLESRDIVTADPDTINIQQRIEIDGKPGPLLLTPDQKKLLAVDYTNDVIRVLDVENDLVEVDRYENLGGEGITCMMWDKQESQLWIAFEKTHSLSLYDTGKKRLTDSYLMGKTPFQMTWGSKEEKVWLIDQGLRQLIVFHPYSRIIDHQYQLDQSPWDILVLE